jgi:hypothetical protein
MDQTRLPAGQSWGGQPAPDEPSNTPAWLAIRTKPNQEQLAFHHYQNMTGYQPLMQVSQPSGPGPLR